MKFQLTMAKFKTLAVSVILDLGLANFGADPYSPPSPVKKLDTGIFSEIAPSFSHRRRRRRYTHSFRFPNPRKQEARERGKREGKGAGMEF